MYPYIWLLVYFDTLAISSGHGSMSPLNITYIWQSNAQSQVRKPKLGANTAIALVRRSLTRPEKQCGLQTYKRKRFSFQNLVSLLL